MPAHKKFEISDDDLRLVISLIKERNRLYDEAKKQEEILRHHEKQMLQLRSEARMLSCKHIAEKIELNKDIVFKISTCQMLRDEIDAVDPDFYFENARVSGRDKYD